MGCVFLQLIFKNGLMNSLISLLCRILKKYNIYVFIVLSVVFIVLSLNNIIKYVLLQEIWGQWWLINLILLICSLVLLFAQDEKGAFKRVLWFIMDFNKQAFPFMLLIYLILILLGNFDIINLRLDVILSYAIFVIISGLLSLIKVKYYFIGSGIVVDNYYRN